jgi:ubiquinone/menaquinone biosynthesis C-methylase UbiE
MKFLGQSDERTMLGSDENPEIVQQHLSRYAFASRFVHEKRVLDVACGIGYGSSILRKAGAREVIGVDRSEETVVLAKRNFGMEGVEFHAGLAEDLSGLGKFDVVVSFETIEHLKRPDKFLEETSRVLNDNGLLIISTPIRESGSLATKPANPYHEREWSEDEFDALLRNYFPVCEPYFQYNLSKSAIRSIKRLVIRFLHQEVFESINAFPVAVSPPLVEGIRLQPIYLVRQCSFR